MLGEQRLSTTFGNRSQKPRVFSAFVTLVEKSTTMGSRSKTKVHVALLVVQANFSVGAIVAAVGMPSLNPLLFALVRESAAGVILYCVGLWQTGMTRPRRWARFVAVGTCVAGTQLFAIVGLKLSGNAVSFAVWQPTQPVAVAAVSILLGWERFEVSRVAGIICAAAGCVMVAATSGHATAGLVANACFALSCAAGAAYQLAAKPLVHAYPAVCVTAWCYCVAAGITVAAALVTAASPAIQHFLCPDCNDDFWTLPTDALPALAWWIFMSTVTNYALQMWAIKHSSPTLVTAYSALQPVLTAALTVLVIFLVPHFECRHDRDNCLTPPDAYDAAACVLVLAGLSFVVRTEARVSSYSPRGGGGDGPLLCDVEGCGVTPLLVGSEDVLEEPPPRAAPDKKEPAVADPPPLREQ